MILNWCQRIKTRWQGLTPRRRTGVIFLVCLLILGGLWWFGFSEAAQAVGTKDVVVKSLGSEVKDGITGFVSWILMGVATFFMRLAIFFMKFLLEVAGYNNYLDSTAVTVGWVMVRDISNMFFVVILLLIAFGTILGVEQYEWKKLLVKFVFAAILVNFSRVIAALIIDAAQVVMVTFLNGVAATAGGNLINAFKLDKLLSFNPDIKPDDLDNVQVVLASFAAVWFAAMTAAVMAGYVMLMAARLVMLWILIVLSPLAFLLNVLPQTQKYASQWWTEFGNHVVVGPILAFFLWLAFVTVGSGNIHDEISQNNNYAVTEEAAMADTNISVGQQTSAGVSEIMKWTSMAGFFIALGMLFAGIKITMSLNTIGGAMFGKAVEYGKKAAMIGSGAAAGLWLGKKGYELSAAAAKATGKGLGKGVLYLTPYEKIKNWGKSQVAGFHAWRKDTGIRPMMKRYTEGAKKGQLILDEKGRPQYEYDEEGNLIMEKKKLGRTQGFFHYFAERDAASRKKLEKTENYAKVRDELLLKRTGGVPKYFFMGKDEQVDALDRVEQGMLAAEKARSESKTKEFQALGRQLVTDNLRFKDGKVETEKPKIIEQIARHEMRAERGEMSLAKGKEEAKQTFLESETGQKVLRQIHELEESKKAASAFIDKIKNTDYSHLFKEASAELARILENAKATGQFNETSMRQVLSSASASAKTMYAEQLSEYFKDLSGIEKLKAVDVASDMMMMDKNRFETQATAFKAAVAKSDENFKGVEREQSVVMAAKSLIHLQYLQQKHLQDPAHNPPLDSLQEAQLFANNKFLTSNAWNDDLLARVVNTIREDQQKINAGQLTGEARAEAELTKKVFLEEFGWGKEEGGQIKVVNRSGEDRANDLQRLVCFAGDYKLLQAENAVLGKQEKDGEAGISKGYSETANEIAEALMGALRGRSVGDLAADEFKRIAEDLGRTTEREVTELKHFAERFVQGSASAAEATKKFTDNIKRYSNQLEMFAGMKDLGVATTHLDDVGHTIYDMKDGFAHSQTSKQAQRFVLSDWVKVDVNKRLSGLKIHGIASLNEDYGTANRFRSDCVRATFDGANTQIILDKSDVRNKRGIRKYAAGEKERNDDTGRLLIADADSVLVKGVHNGDAAAALREVAEDWKTVLENAPHALTYYLGSVSGKTYDQAMAGELNIKVGNTNINNVEQLTDWIRETIGAELNPEKIKRMLRAASKRAVSDEEEGSIT